MGGVEVYWGDIDGEIRGSPIGLEVVNMLEKDVDILHRWGYNGPDYAINNYPRYKTYNGSPTEPSPLSSWGSEYGATSGCKEGTFASATDLYTACRGPATVSVGD